MLIILVMEIYSIWFQLIGVHVDYFYDSGVLNGKKVENHWFKWSSEAIQLAMFDI